jgi:hypothetical protein
VEEVVESLVNRDDHGGREIRMADFRAQIAEGVEGSRAEPAQRTPEAIGGYPGPKQVGKESRIRRD